MLSVMEENAFRAVLRKNIPTLLTGAHSKIF